MLIKRRKTEEVISDTAIVTTAVNNKTVNKNSETRNNHTWKWKRVKNEIYLIKINHIFHTKCKKHVFKPKTDKIQLKSKKTWKQLKHINTNWKRKTHSHKQKTTNIFNKNTPKKQKTRALVTGPWANGRLVAWAPSRRAPSDVDSSLFSDRQQVSLMSAKKNITRVADDKCVVPISIYLHK